MEHNSPKIDQETLEAYQRAIYTVEKPKLSIKIGEMNEDLNVFLFDNNAYFWAYISAANPRSIERSEEENQSRHEDLIKKVKSMRFRYCEGYGKNPDSGNYQEWTPEKSILILDIPKQKAIELAKTFDQNAIVYGTFNREPQLIFC